MEDFFRACISFDEEIEIKELILRRYKDPEYIFSMEVADFIRFLNLAREKEYQDQIRMQWTAHLPYMSMKQLEYISFEDYYDRVCGKNIDWRPVSVIMEEIEELHRQKGAD